jgi:hypothetical protein
LHLLWEFPPEILERFRDIKFPAFLFLLLFSLFFIIHQKNPHLPNSPNNPGRLSRVNVIPLIE